MLNKTCPYLFVYGTLQVPGNPFADWLKRNSNVAGKGKLRGILYDLGNYPAAVYDQHADSMVAGSIVLLNDPDGAFKKLDEYEGDEYERKLLPIEIDDNKLNCWVYLYNLSVKDLLIITSGNYADYLK